LFLYRLMAQRGDLAQVPVVVAWHDYGRMGVNGVSKWLHEFRRQGRQIFRIPGGSLAYARI